MRAPQKGMQFDFVDREYAVVRRFHNPLSQGLKNLAILNGGTLPGKPKAALPAPPSATPHAKRPETAKGAKSIKSVKSIVSMAGDSTKSNKSNTGQRPRVSFHTGASPDSGRQSPVDDSDDERGDGMGREHHGQPRPLTAGEIARRIWEGAMDPRLVSGVEAGA